jgi:hypothetical protein
VLLVNLVATRFPGAGVPVRVALPLTAVVLFALAAGALQWWYLDRLAVRAGGTADDASPDVTPRDSAEPDVGVPSVPVR